MTYKIDIILDREEILIKRLDYSFCEVEALDISILSAEEKLKFDNFLSDKRRLEFYFTRILIKSFKLTSKVCYLDNGKPIISDGHISISHSQQTILVAFSKSYFIGVDIEYFKDKIQRIKHKFLADLEYEVLDTESIEVLTTVWSIKEAVYKLMNKPGLLFNENIVVHSTETKPFLEIRLNGNSNRYPFDVLHFEDYLITYLFHPEELK